MVAVFPNLSVNVTQQRLTCVFDPTLVLSTFGLNLAKRLSTWVDLWIPRAVWHIVDETPVYLQWPERLPLDNQLDVTSNSFLGSESVLTVLQEWEQLRLSPVGAKSPKLYYFADSLQESVLPEEMDAETIWQFEALSSCLDNRLTSTTPLIGAYRDTLALAATLPTAMILAQLPNDSTENATPLLCKQSERWQIFLQKVDVQDPWVQLERTALREQLVLLGLAKLHWAGLRLAVIHLLMPPLPPASTLRNGEDRYLNLDEGIANTEQDYWQQVRGYWYPL